MRRKLVAGNWKMNGSTQLVKELVGALRAEVSALDNGVEVVIIPPALYLRDAQREAGDSGLGFGVQNISRWQQGAYTGELSAAMVADLDAGYALVGHSERRELFGEADEEVAAKVSQALAQGIRPIVCVGESLAQREAGEAEAVVCSQVELALASVSGDDWQKLVIAYEPVWAIGTGRTATARDAQDMHVAIRGRLARMSAQADSISLLYGGSVKPDNAAELFAQPDIDGGLIGGASLQAEDFIRICRAL
ncbi:MAG: triose-phosphate isomerase [Marinobacter sp.]|uniref:triose-phosphate isomerase n=1 Tax=Marinobacter sp. TaxID=50741 RepID=UPI00299E376D|nr:triose-phosphate isomerase [Marinobacter sp.]MDX1635142.1 triose-phosphate isomerase [Marinobacter sp.]